MNIDTNHSSKAMSREAAMTIVIEAHIKRVA